MKFSDLDTKYKTAKVKDKQEQDRIIVIFVITQKYKKQLDNKKKGKTSG